LINLLRVTDSVILGSVPMLVANLNVSDDRVLFIATPLRKRQVWSYWLEIFGWVEMKVVFRVAENASMVFVYTFQV
jgi:hypothetical protein